jgi:hypothetical protein
LSPPEEQSALEEHLRECAECRDLALFVWKPNAIVIHEGRPKRIADAFGISVEELMKQIERKTPLADLVQQTEPVTVRHRPSICSPSPTELPGRHPATAGEDKEEDPK